jgi:histidyl-tRNA synthetase
VVIDTDNGVDDTDSIDEIACIRQCQKAKELHSYSGVTSLGQVWAILKLHKDGSIPALAISGHGGIGGVMFEAGENEDGYVPDTNFDGHTLGGGKYDEVVDMIKKKLKPGATIYVLGCNACSGGLNERGTQKLADVTGRKVVANESAVTFIEHPYSPTTIGDKFVGVGNWFIFEPKVKSAPLAPVHQ